MDAFTTLTGLVAPLDRPNVDTDAIIPKMVMQTRSSKRVNPLFLIIIIFIQ